ncbi:MAG: 2-iminoacetate synthase ThiH [Spirochaetia bacterium]|nr:2-iminoacetate synthase ThiH [Spirochaetota bacterium]MDW8112781.1 2-iminoacetate synthase ThiH [Spirochaetia bacterium]
MIVLEKKSFKDVLDRYYDWDFDTLFDNVTYDDVERALSKEYLNDHDLISLISPKAQKYIEYLARKSFRITRQFFGNVMFIYAPLYVSDHCVNACLYCGFSVFEKFKRKTLNLDEVRKEAEILRSKGIRHVLLLTGESKFVGIDYITSVVKILKEYFDEVSIEIYPMDEDDYRKVIESGAEGLTVYQETYDKDIYDKLHVFGPKKNYLYRLETPDRGGRAGFREINIGALLGLAPVRKEIFLTLKHAEYLFETYPDVEIGISFPRMRPIHNSSSFKFDIYEVSDTDMVQFISVARIFLNRIAINISTRESSEFRDNIALLGPTRMSAESSTAVGGYSQNIKSSQFDVSDERTIEEFVKMLESKGLCPTFVNWIREFNG